MTPARCLLAVLLFSACADAQTPAEGVDSAPSPAPFVIVDGRDLDAAPDASDRKATWEGVAAVQAAIGAARAYWSAKDPGYEEDVRVLDVAEGAFTRPGASEHAVLYLVSLWPRCCPKIGLAIVEGDPGPSATLVENVAFEGSTQGVQAIPDLDGDGLDELVLRSSFGMGGEISASATLAAFGSEGLASRGGLGIYEGACGALRDGEAATRLLAVPGEEPAFTTETYMRARCEGGLWESAGAPQPLTLQPPSEHAYVRLERVGRDRQ
ncbi:MAG: hypothetical protein Rubg2KO_10720 [Rubricoccaceae bacterium]